MRSICAKYSITETNRQRVPHNRGLPVIWRNFVQQADQTVNVGLHCSPCLGVDWACSSVARDVDRDIFGLRLLIASSVAYIYSISISLV